MKTVLTLVVLLLTPASVPADCPECPPKLDWVRIDTLWSKFVPEASDALAGELLAAFPADDNVAVPAANRHVVEAMAAHQDSVVRAATETRSWAIQLAFRLLRIEHYPRKAELSSAISALATSQPEFFLHELAKFFDENPCVNAFCGIVQHFGSPQEIADGADPRLDEVVARIHALGSVDDPSLRELRGWCLGLLQVQKEHIEGSPIPRILKRVDVDDLAFAGILVKGTFVVVETTIAMDGRVARVKLLRGIHPEIDAAFLEAIKQWVYEPPSKNGHPAEFTYIQTLRVSLQ